MGFSMRLYGGYLRLLSLPLALLLYIGGWKKAVLRSNLECCGFSVPGFRWRFCLHVSLDFLRFLHGKYELPIRVRCRDQIKLNKLKSHSSLFLTAHFHHWEWMGAWLTRGGVPLLSAARPLKHPGSELFLGRLRERLGVAVVQKNVPRRALLHLDSQGCFALLWDQRVARSDVRAPLFAGKDLMLDPLPCFLIRHRPVPVWFGTLLPDGTFRLLLLSSSPSRLLSDPNRLARRYHRVLEILIRRHPTWWYGMAHRRFLDPSIGGSVSRETSARPEVMVSRETNSSL